MFQKMITFTLNLFYNYKIKILQYFKASKLLTFLVVTTENQDWFKRWKNKKEKGRVLFIYHYQYVLFCKPSR